MRLCRGRWGCNLLACSLLLSASLLVRATRAGLSRDSPPSLTRPAPTLTAHSFPPPPSPPPQAASSMVGIIVGAVVGGLLLLLLLVVLIVLRGRRAERRNPSAFERDATRSVGMFEVSTSRPRMLLGTPGDHACSLGLRPVVSRRSTRSGGPHC